MDEASWQGVRGQVRIEAAVGDIADQRDLEAVVNAANAQLISGGGVAGALHRTAGPGLVEEASAYAPIRAGDCVLTGGHALPNRHVLHCLGPVWGVDEPAQELLAACYRNALRQADAAAIRSVGFPALSTGAFGYPLREATEVAVATLLEVVEDGLEHVRLVRFVLASEKPLASYREVLGEYLREP